MQMPTRAGHKMETNLNLKAALSKPTCAPRGPLFSTALEGGLLLLDLVTGSA